MIVDINLLNSLNINLTEQINEIITLLLLIRY